MLRKTTPTLSEIVEHTKASGSHFFDRKTLKFFGQRLSDFHVVRSPISGRIYVYAKNHKTGVYTVAEWLDTGAMQGAYFERDIPNRLDTRDARKVIIAQDEAR